METWQEMTDRHALEKAEAVMALSDKGLTQTEAARALKMDNRMLEKFLRRNGLPWRVRRQGAASRPTIMDELRATEDALRGIKTKSWEGGGIEARKAAKAMNETGA